MLLDEVTDPFVLEVHRPVTLNRTARLPPLPPYVPRAHDRELAEVAARAVAGVSAMAVLVAGSSAGKTRACWQALEPLRQAGGWRLWHPYDPDRAGAALRGLPIVGPRTVVWLNETQEYLGGSEGERVAAGLRSLLADPARAPVLLLGTLWPEHHAGLTSRPGSQVRAVLDGTVIEVPAAFASADLAALRKAASGDARLAWAAEYAEDGQIAQYLAGGPALLDRYHTAPPVVKALIWAAMDARRLGMNSALPLAFLEAAAPGYLPDAEWDVLGEDWAEQALAYTAVPCKGARGPLTRIRPRPVRARQGEGARVRGAWPEELATGPACRLADFLDQHGRAERAAQLPPTDFWAAAAAHAAPSAQAALARAAHDRGLYRDAAQLHKNAAAAANLRAGLYLANPPGRLRADPRPAHWAAAHANLGDTLGVGVLLRRLLEAGSVEQVAALLARDPAGHASLDSPHGVAWLLDSLRAVGAHEQVAALLARDPAGHASLRSTHGVAGLLDSLRAVGAHEQVAALLARDPAGHVSLDSSYIVVRLLDRLREVGAVEQVTALASRVAAYADTRRPGDVGVLLGGLTRVGASEQFTALARRAVAHVNLNDPREVAWLLERLQAVGAQEQADALLARDLAARVDLAAPAPASRGVAQLLDKLRYAGAGEQVTALLAREPAAHVSLGDPHGASHLLDILPSLGAGEQVSALLAREPAAHVSLGDPRGVSQLLGSLLMAGADEQFTALATRAAAHGNLDDPGDVVWLLSTLRDFGADEQFSALASRAARHVNLSNARSNVSNARGVALLLGMLRKADAADLVNTLTDRLPDEGMFDLFLEQSGLSDQFHFGRQTDGTAAAAWGWDDLD